MIKSGVAVAGGLLLAVVAGCATLGVQATASSRHTAKSPSVTAYVAVEYPDAVRPIRLATGKILPPVVVHGQVFPMAVTPDGGTVVAATYVGNNRTIVTLIHATTGKAFRAFDFTGFPFVWPVAFTSGGKTAYIVNDSRSGTVIPIQIRTGYLGPPIHVGHNPGGMAITPDGKTLYVANEHSGTVTPIQTATNATLRPIRVGRMPGAIVITPDGKTAYVDSETTDTVTPIQIATKTALKPIKAGRPAGYPDPHAIVITPNGRTVYRLDSGGVIPISVATNRAHEEIPVSLHSAELAMTPDGKIVYAIDPLYGVVTPIRTATNTALPKISVARQIIAGVAITPDSRFMYIGTKGGLLIPVRIATGKLGKPIRLRGLISTFAIAP